MNKKALAGAAAAVLAGCGVANAAEMGAVDEPIKLAINEWTGQHVSTHVAGEMLKKAGYQVEYVTAGYMNMFQAMADGEVHAALEIWTSNVSDQFAVLEEAGGVVDVSDLGLDAKEGFAYPAHVAEICPGLPAWEALKDCAGQFATAETIPQGRLLDYPADWGTPGADRVAGLQLPFKAVPAGSEGALISEIRASTEKKSPLLVVFWQPHWAMAAYDLQFAELPEGTAECYDDPSWGPNPDATSDCDFIPTRIFKAAWSGMAEKWPAAYEIIDNYRLSTEQQEPLMGQIDVDGMSVEDAVTAFLDENEDYWKPVVDAATQ
ncbi:MAG: ABC transporter substrate-binding protein [Pseudomonadota bacterium]